MSVYLCKGSTNSSGTRYKVGMKCVKEMLPPIFFSLLLIEIVLDLLQVVSSRGVQLF